MSTTQQPITVGMIAGWGRFPVVVSQAIRDAGHRVVCCGIKGHADESLKSICNEFEWCGLTKMGFQIRVFKRHNVNNVTMAGKIFKTLLFSKNYLWHNLPDWTCLKHFLPVVHLKDRKDDTLLGAATTMFESHGFEFTPAVDFAPNLLVSKGTLTKRKPNQSQHKDIGFGWQLAKEMGRLDIGQSVAVKGKAVLAVEAVEGTDQCIRRAGELCSGGEFVVVKVAKPEQDMRFDVPTVGVSTIETMHESGGRILAIEAHRTIILDQEKMVERANQFGIGIVAVDPAEFRHKKT